MLGTMMRSDLQAGFLNEYSGARSQTDLVGRWRRAQPQRFGNDINRAAQPVTVGLLAAAMLP